MKKTFLILSLLAVGATAHAKLPAPPAPTPEAAAKAAEAKAKADHGNKVAAFQLCKSMDKAAANHMKTMVAMGKTAAPAANAPACTDPGPFVAPKS